MNKFIVFSLRLCLLLSAFCLNIQYAKSQCSAANNAYSYQELIPSASAGTFSCDQYVRWRMSNSWVEIPQSFQYSGISNQSSQWISGDNTFVPVSHSDAPIVSSSGGHSAYRASGSTDLFISKNNNGGPLIKSTAHSTLFPGTVQLYKPIGELTSSIHSIVRNQTINVNCGTSFSLGLPYINGLTYKWMQSNSNVVNIVSPNSNSTTITPIGNGQVVLTLYFYDSNCTDGSLTDSSVRSQQVTINISGCCSINGTYANNNQTKVLNTFNAVKGATTTASASFSCSGQVVWTQTSGNGSVTSNSGNTVVFNLLANQTISFQVSVVGTNISRNVAFMRSSFMSKNEDSGINSSFQEKQGNRNETNDFKASFYSNPIIDNLHIKFNKLATGSVEIINLYGQNVLKKDFTDSEIFQADNLAFPTGTYLLLVRDINGKILDKRKFVKQ